MSNSDDRFHGTLDRRALLRAMGLAAGGLLLAPLVGPGSLAASLAPRSSGPVKGNDVLFALWPRSVAPDGDSALELSMAAMDFSWLGRGDSVFIKVQSNSIYPHPATTSPGALAALIRGLFARGAGRVIVGDQAGVQWVRLAENNERFSSTRAVFLDNGLFAAANGAGAEMHFFDEQDYDDGYVEGQVDFPGSHWTKTPRIARITEEVDHIVYLCRLSSHMIAGYSHGHKTAVGWLRDDSRHHFHNKADTFFEKYVEINHLTQIQSRLRLVISVAESFMLDQGPDVGTVVEAEPIVVIASENMANHDALGVGVLGWVDEMTPRDASVRAPYGENSDLYNLALVRFAASGPSGIPWGDEPLRSYRHLVPHAYQQSITGDTALARAYALQGGMPSTIPVALMGSEPHPGLLLHLDDYGGGRFAYGAVEG